MDFQSIAGGQISLKFKNLFFIFFNFNTNDVISLVVNDYDVINAIKCLNFPFVGNRVSKDQLDSMHF